MGISHRLWPPNAPGNIAVANHIPGYLQENLARALLIEGVCSPGFLSGIVQPLEFSQTGIQRAELWDESEDLPMDATQMSLKGNVAR